jgi:hypothetical protein
MTQVLLDPELGLLASLIRISRIGAACISASLQAESHDKMRDALYGASPHVFSEIFVSLEKIRRRYMSSAKSSNLEPECIHGVYLVKENVNMMTKSETLPGIAPPFASVRRETRATAVKNEDIVFLQIF